MSKNIVTAENRTNYIRAQLKACHTILWAVNHDIENELIHKRIEQIYVELLRIYEYTDEMRII